MSALRFSLPAVDTARVPDQAWEREDVDAVVGGIWDIKMLLIRLIQLLGDDEEEADE
jgi:hypothetical protein